MAGSELYMVALAPGDIGAGLALSGAVGWNQTAQDWALFIAQGHAIGFRTAAGALVSTAAAIVYGSRFGWLSMVLVAPDWRHRGLASLLMMSSIERLRASHIAPVLEATPAGEPVYRHLGFQSGFALTRWQGAGGLATFAPNPDVNTATFDDLDTLAALDQGAHALPRRALLHDLLRRPGTRAWLHGDGGGFVLSREGRRARQIGPLVASGPDAALALLDTALADAEGAVFLDVPQRWSGLAERLEAAGFTRQRPFVRMALDSAQPLSCGERLFVLAGPEFG